MKVMDGEERTYFKRFEKCKEVIKGLNIKVKFERSSAEFFHAPWGFTISDEFGKLARFYFPTNVAEVYNESFFGLSERIARECGDINTIVRAW